MSARSSEFEPPELGDCRFYGCGDSVGAPHYVGDKILVGRVCRGCQKGIFGVSS